MYVPLAFLMAPSLTRNHEEASVKAISASAAEEHGGPPFFLGLTSRVGEVYESQVAVNRRGCVFFAQDGKKRDEIRRLSTIYKLMLLAVACFWVRPDEEETCIGP